MITYLDYIDQILQTDSVNTDWNSLEEEHLVQISFFQHERLVHLLVTILFAVLAFMTLILMAIQFSFSVLALFLAVIVLLIPYIRHYYLLENGVQKMYKQYDEIHKHMKKEAF